MLLAFFEKTASAMCNLLLLLQLFGGVNLRRRGDSLSHINRLTFKKKK